ncbi:GT2 family glycosyltransferase [Nonomuraea fuscirosea]|uniref:GT2 family glycosyltransferase n=1 Tax=Nonomuraea fuscirosea TaxID=1291556 RepID=A0A2T0MSF4_9ACTN|nr:glycosyltransferase family 2 protein [Nonomuraea fuscirosea]PRX61398.1 GT2 family glycosyltransferase [Nonomuraea fuscirosea]
MRRVAVVIVTYNSADVLQGCLDSLPAGAAGVELAAVVVADNASKDDSTALAAARADLPVTVVQVGRNAGYAAAINAGIAALDLDRLDGVYVLNPDCRLRSGAIAPLLDCLEQPGRGIVVPYMVNPDGTLQPSLRRMPTVGRAVAEAVVGGALAGRMGTAGELVTDPRDYARPGAFAWATGAALMLAPRMIREVGAWDESFLLYSEETDYCLRAADLGWATWYEPASVVEHIGGASGIDPVLASLLVVNKVRLFRRRHGPVRGTAYYVAVLAGEAVRALAGRRTSRASVVALLRPSRRMTALPQ